MRTIKRLKVKNKYKIQNARKGIVLIIILMLIAAITIVGLGFIVRGDTQLQCGENMDMASDISYLAESGLEHGRGLIINPQDINDVNGWSATSQQLVSGSSDYYDVSVKKLSELNWQIASSAYRVAGASRTAQNNLTSNLRLYPAIALWSGTSISLYPDATITGDVYNVSSGSGIINGSSFTTLPVNEPNINSSILTSNFTTQTISGSGLNSQTLPSSGLTLVCYKNGTLTIGSNVIINCGLAVDGDLTITGSGNVINAAKNVPALYVNGNLIMGENTSLDCNGIVLVKGMIQTPICNRRLTVDGSFFLDNGVRLTVPDYSGSGNNGIINGSCSWAAGKYGGAINFNGSGDYINVGDSSQLDSITQNITVSVWVKVTSFNKSYQTIIGKGDTAWQLRSNATGDNIQFALHMANGDDISVSGSSAALKDGQWHNIMGIYDKTAGLYVYLDGMQLGWYEPDGNINTNSSPVYIGGNYGHSDRYFSGLIDDVRIYKTNFLLADITNFLLNPFSFSTNNLVGYWSMDWGNCSMMINFSQSKAAIYHWPNGSKDRWSAAAGAFYTSIARN